MTNFGSNTVTLIDTATNTVDPTLTAGANPESIAITPDGTTAYVADNGSGTMVPIDTATNAVGAAIGVGPGPTDIFITPDGTTAYVGSAGADRDPSRSRDEDRQDRVLGG